MIAKVDADGEGRPLGEKYGVTGFPSAYIIQSIYDVFSRCSYTALKWFDANGNEEKYESGRDLESLAAL